jgi:membrane protein implicated in regulation of membrane protease activity
VFTDNKELSRGKGIMGKVTYFFAGITGAIIIFFGFATLATGLASPVFFGGEIAIMGLILIIGGAVLIWGGKRTMRPSDRSYEYEGPKLTARQWEELNRGR